MSFHDALRRHHGNLTPADEAIVRELLERPHEHIFSTALELAHAAGVHAASVVRLAQKLGYEGYPECRDALRADLHSSRDAADRVRGTLDESSLLGDLIRNDIAALQQLPEHIDDAALEAAAKRVAESRSVHLFARGHATGVTEVLARRLRRQGVLINALTGPRRDLAERVAAADHRDVFLAVTLRRIPRELPALLVHLHEREVPTVLIADAVGPLVRPEPTQLLAAPRGGRHQEFQTLTVPLAVATGLVLALARVDQGRSLQSLEALSETIERFEEPQRRPACI